MEISKLSIPEWLPDYIPVRNQSSLLFVIYIMYTAGCLAVIVNFVCVVVFSRTWGNG